MQIVIDSIRHYILSREFNTRKVTVEKDTSATADYPEGLLLAVDTSNNKMKVAENADSAVCALLNRIPKASIIANDVKAEVVYISGLAKPKIIDSNEPLQITQKFIEKAGKNGLDIMKTLPDKKINVVSLAITGSFTNTQYTGRPVNPTGLTFKATYSDGDVEVVTDDVTVSPATWGETVGEQTATFSFTDGEATVTATKTVTVVSAG